MYTVYCEVLAVNFLRSGQREVSGVSFATRPELTKMLVRDNEAH